MLTFNQLCGIIWLQEVINMAKIGENIRRKREELGLSQEELATRMGYKSKSTINKIELGINDIPQNKISKFAGVLGTTPAVLMGWVDEQIDKKNDDMFAIVNRMKNDEKFLAVVKKLNCLDDDTLDLAEKMISAFR